MYHYMCLLFGHLSSYLIVIHDFHRFSIKVKKSTNTLVSSGFHDLPLSLSPSNAEGVGC